MKITDKRWELTKNEKIRADSAHNVRVALERMDCHIERGDGAMVYRIYNRHVAQWQTHYLDNRGNAWAAVGHTEYVWLHAHASGGKGGGGGGDAAMTEPTISEMQAANTVNRIRGYFESKRMEIEGKRAFRREARLAKVVRLAGELVEAIEGIGDDDNEKDLSGCLDPDGVIDGGSVPGDLCIDGFSQKRRRYTRGIPV